MKTVYEPSFLTSFRKLLLLLLTVALSAGHSVAQDYTYVRTIGTNGAGAGQLYLPSNVTTDKDRNLYVADYGNHRVQVFNAQGEFLRQVSGDGTEPGKVHYPFMVEIGPDGNLYVGSMNGLDIFTLDGQFLRRPVNPEGVYGLAFDQAGNVYLATAFEVEVYNTDFTQHLKTIGQYGNGNGQFNNTRDIAFDREGNMFVADMMNHRIEVFTAGGEYLAKFGTQGSGDGQLSPPTGIAQDGAGFMYIVDGGNRRIVVGYFDTSDLTWHTVLTFGSLGTGNNQFQGLADVKMDNTGTIYASDFTAGHVKVFSKSPNEVLDFTDMIKTYGDEDFILHAVNKEAPEYGVMFEKAEDPSSTGDIAIARDSETGNYTAKILRAGHVKIRAIAPDDPVHGTATKDITLIIDKAGQQITFGALAPRVFGEAAFVLTAAASSGLPVAFETSNPLIASITGNTATLKAPGTVTIIAQQNGNENYLAAEPVEQPLDITAVTGIGYEEHNSVRVYPIPAQDAVTINAAFTSEVLPVTVCDIQGRVVRQIIPEAIDAQTRRVNLAGLNAGLYLLKLNDSKNSTTRLIKN